MNKRFLTNDKIKKFKERLIETEKRPATVEKYLRNVAAFAAFSAKGEITKKTVVDYKKLIETKYAARSVNSIIASVNGLFAFLGWSDYKLKFVRVQKQAFCKKERELKKSEYESLCRIAKKRQNERLNLILQTVCATGIRISELKFVTVESVCAGEAVVNCKAKTRVIFIVKKLRVKLLKYANKKHIKSGAIFVTRSKKPVDRSNVWREMKSLSEEAGVNKQKVFPHNLRKLFARIFYEAQKDVAKLADVLGHSSIETTRIYIATCGSEHRRFMENMRLII